ncbi:MAG: FkbM family methyltransferase [Terriglobia bacterium]
MNSLQNLTHNPRLVGFARHLHVAAPLKSLEYWLRGPSDGVIRQNVAGVDVLFAAPDATELRTLESCYADEMDFIGALRETLRFGDVFYDVGSNAGQFLIAAAKIVGDSGRAIGFEAHPGNYERLLKNVALNQLTNVRAFRVALSDARGEVQMFGERGTATIVPAAARYHQDPPTCAVPAVSGDDLRRSEGLPVPKAAKVDVEGAEFAVLSGLAETLSNPACELLCCEVHPPLLPEGTSPASCFSLVRSLGFNQMETKARGNEIHLIARRAFGQSRVEVGTDDD